MFKKKKTGFLKLLFFLDFSTLRKFFNGRKVSLQVNSETESDKLPNTNQNEKFLNAKVVINFLFYSML